MGISKVLLFRQVIYHKSHPPIMPNGNIITRFAKYSLSQQEIRDIDEPTATLPPRLLNAESEEKESLHTAAFEHSLICKLQNRKKKALAVKTGW